MPSLSALPHETLMEILMQPQLSYKDLKCLARTCKLFRDIEAASLESCDHKLDAKMFRVGLPPSELEKVILAKKDLVDIKYHPIFDYVDLVSTSIEHIGPSMKAAFHYVDRLDDTPMEFSTLPCMDEYATSPACRRIVWQELHVEEVTVSTEREYGVTVRDVLEDVYEMWRKETSATFKREFVDQLEEDLAEDDSGWRPSDAHEDRIMLLVELEIMPLTYMMAIPEMTTIERLGPAKVIEDDCVQLSVEWGTGQY